MTMCATVSGIEDNRLLVINETTNQEIAVNTSCLNFCQGDRVKIFYNGMMTFSLPPQITARKILKIK